MEIQLQASGSLWRDALVMHDLQTGTLFSQVSGIAIKGPHSGYELERFPSFITTYAEYVRNYPNGKILKKGPGERNTPYESYYRDSQRLGIFGRQNQDPRLEGKSRVIGLRSGTDELAVPLDESGQSELRTEIIDGQRLWTYWNPATETARVWQTPRSCEDDEASLDSAGMIVNARCGGAWNPVTGMSRRSGGENLTPYPFLISYWFAWKTFFPLTRIAFGE